MYSFINKKPTKEDIRDFKMAENVNENFINFVINPNLLSIEEKKRFISKYKLDNTTLLYKDSIFLAMPKP